MATTAEYLAQLQADKQTLVDNLVAKGVEASNDETFTSLTAKVADICDFEITDASYLFYNGARMDYFDLFMSLISPNCSNFKYIFGFCSNSNEPMEIKKLETSTCIDFSYACYAFRGLTAIPTLNLIECTNMNGAFAYCENLKNLTIQNTGKITDFTGTFHDCFVLESISDLDLSSATKAQEIFYNCRKLKNVILRNSKNVPNFTRAFDGCSSLISVQVDTDGADNIGYMFCYCNKLETVSELNLGKATYLYWAFQGCSSLMNFGGAKDLGKAFSTTSSANSYTFDLTSTSKLTHESVLNVLNGLYDIASKGCNPQRIRFHANVMALLSEDEIAIGTNKGWNITT